MAAVSFSMYDSDDNAVNSGNKIDFGLVQKSKTSAIKKVKVWNDRNGTLGSVNADAPKIHAVPATGNPSTIFTGTESNGFNSMLEARSCGGENVSGDAQTNWSPIRDDQFLSMGFIPKNAAREIEIRLNVPYDAADQAAADFHIRVFA